MILEYDLDPIPVAPDVSLNTASVPFNTIGLGNDTNMAAETVRSNLAQTDQVAPEQVVPETTSMVHVQQLLSSMDNIQAQPVAPGNAENLDENGKNFERMFIFLLSFYSEGSKIIQRFDLFGRFATAPNC